MAHIPQILRAIGMDRILTEYYSWRSQTSNPGAQIDLIIDRADGFLNLCEVKHSKGDYALTKAEADKIDNRVSAFQQTFSYNGLKTFYFHLFSPLSVTYSKPPPSHLESGGFVVTPFGLIRRYGHIGRRHNKAI